MAMDVKFGRMNRIMHGVDILILLCSFTTAKGDGCTTVRDVTLVNGGSAELYCKINNEPISTTFYKKTWSKTVAQGYERQVYTYIKNGVHVTDIKNTLEYGNRLEGMNKDAFRMKNVTGKDGGTYRCSWEVDPGIPGCLDASATFSVTVIVKISNVIAQVSSPIREGGSTTFRCTASGTSPITYTWQLAGVVISAARWTDHGDGNASVSDIQRHDAGEYTCIADNAAKRPQNSSVTLVVQYPPSSVRLVSSLTGGTHLKNTQVTFTCTADGGNPVPNVTIYRGADRMGAAKATATQTIKLSEADNKRSITCKATSNGIDGTMSSNTFKYNVLFPHSVTLKATSNPVLEGNTVILTCTASGGNPDTVDSYRWQTTATQTVTSSSNTLTLTHVQYTHAGLYTCYVTNAGGTASGELPLDILFSPKEDPTKISKYSISAEYNQTVTFTLSVLANPLPMFTWLREVKDGQRPLLMKSKVFNGKLNSKLIIPFPTRADMVAYICIVNNKVGQTRFVFRLIPADAPDPPQNIKVIYKTALSIILHWLAGFNGGFTQTFSVMYRESGQPWPNEPQINNIADPGENRRVEYEVSGLKEKVTYDIRVRAVNARQTGENKSPYSAHVTGTTKDKPIVSFSVSRDPHSSDVTISIQPPIGHYTDIKVKYCEQENSEICGRQRLIMTSGDANTKIIGLKPGTFYTYTLELYDKNTLVYSSAAFKAKIKTSQRPTAASDDSGLVAGAVIGSLTVLGIITASIALYLWKRRTGTQNSKEESSCDHIYENFTQNLAATEPNQDKAIYENIRMMTSNRKDVIQEMYDSNKQEISRDLLSENAYDYVQADRFRRDLTMSPDGSKDIQGLQNVYEDLKKRDSDVSEGQTYATLQVGNNA